MVKVNFTSALKRFFPGLEAMEVEAKTVAEVVKEIDKQHPGLKAYVVEQTGGLRKHVNIFIGEHLVRDKKKLSDKLEENDEIFIMQALSGG